MFSPYLKDINPCLFNSAVFECRNSYEFCFLSVCPGIAITTEREATRRTTPVSETDSTTTVPTHPTTRSTASTVYLNFYYYFQNWKALSHV